MASNRSVSLSARNLHDKEKEKAATSGAGVRVVCRLRPMNDREKQCNMVPAATASTERKEVAVSRMMAGGTRQQRSCFHFDEVLTSFSTQSEVFSSTLEPLISDVLAGYEATAFAYGQTGTGKTYTMEGNLDSDEGRGMVPRAAAAVIGKLATGDYSEYSVTVSYLEIYNEELSDLLVPANQQQKLDLKDVGSGRGVCCIGLSEVQVFSVSDILSLVQRAQERRRVAETRVNARSSRSHSIFTMKVRCRRVIASGELENTGKLHLVDLAGSECAKKAASLLGEEPLPLLARNSTLATDEERERRSINQSLLTLGRVIQALREGSSRVPYRDSKLTRLLQDALGGRCKTVIIATISPAIGAVEETISTLTYAEQACGITNKPVAASLLRSIRMAATGEAGLTTATTGDFYELELRANYLQQELHEAQLVMGKYHVELQEATEKATFAEERALEAETVLRTTQQELEEQSFARGRLSCFADGRVGATKVLDVAVKAFSVHAEDLERQLAAQLASEKAAKQQARQACDLAEKSSFALAEVIKSRSKEVNVAAAETLTAHRASTSVALEINQEQHRVMQQLAADVLELRGKRDVDGGALADDAMTAIGTQSEGTIKAFDSLEQHSQALVAAFGAMQEDIGAAFFQADATIREKHGKTCEDLEMARFRISSQAGQSAAALKEALAAATSSFEESQAQMEETVCAPSAKLAEELTLGVSQEEKHKENLQTLHSAEKVAVEVSTKRWAEVLAALELLAGKHSENTEIESTSVISALKEVELSFKAGSKAASVHLEEARMKLAEGQQLLSAAVFQGERDVSEAVKNGDKELNAAWVTEAAALKALESILEGALQRQRLANVSAAMRAEADSSSFELVAAAAAAATALAAESAEVQSQIVALQKQRAAETVVLELLKEQKSVLASDVAGLQKTLCDTVAEISTARAQLSGLRAAQEVKRAKILEEMNSFVMGKMKELGEELDGSLQETEAGLNQATDFVAAAGHQATASQKKSEDFVDKTETATAAWAKAVDFTSTKLSESVARAKDVAEQENEATQHAAKNIDSLGQKAFQWGEQSDEVAGLIEVAFGQVHELQSWLTELTPHWDSSRQQILDAKTMWVQSSGAASASFESATLEAKSTEEAMRSLSTDQEQRRVEADDKVASWLVASKQHSQAQGAVMKRTQELKADDSEAGHIRSEALSDVWNEAVELHSSAMKRATAAAELQRAAERQLADAPAQHDAIVKAFGDGQASLDRIIEQVSVAAADAQRGATMMRDNHLEAASQIKGFVLAGEEKIQKTAKEDISAVLSAQQMCSKDFTSAAMEFWQKEKVESSLALEAVQKAVNTANANAEAARRVGSDRIQAELERGVRARANVELAIDAVSSVAVSTLGKSQAELRGSLASEPLAAFVETVGVIPSRPEAAICPKVDIVDRPSDAELLDAFRSRPEAAQSIREVHLQAIEPLRENILPTWAVKTADAEFHKAASGNARRDGNRVALADVSRQN